MDAAAVVLGILFGIAAVAAVLLFLQLANARSQANQAKADIDGGARAAERARGRDQEGTEALESKRRESDELKEKLKEVKKRRHEEKESARLKQDIQHAREQIEREMEKKLQAAREEAEISKAQVKKLSEEVASLKSRKPERAQEPKPEAARPAEPAAPLPPRQATPEEVKRAEEAEKAAAQAKRKVEDIQEEIKRVRARAETDRRVFLVQKSEVELAKDKFRSMEAKANALILERDELKKAVWLLEKEFKSLKPTAEAAPEKKQEKEAPKPAVAESKPAEAAAPAEVKPVEAPKARRSRPRPSTPHDDGCRLARPVPGTGAAAAVAGPKPGAWCSGLALRRWQLSSASRTPGSCSSSSHSPWLRKTVAWP
jgi:chromosome segregation ATPase